MGKTSTHRHKGLDAQALLRSPVRSLSYGAPQHGCLPRGSATQGTRGHKFSHKRERDAKFNLPHADVLYEAIQKELAGEPPKPREINEDLPGLGQFYCTVSGRYFETQEALDTFKKTKLYKRSLKRLLSGPPHSQADAEAAAGMGKPKNK